MSLGRYVGLTFKAVVPLLWYLNLRRGQESDVRTALATPRTDGMSQTQITSPFNPMGILSAPISSQPAYSFHPSKYTAVQLWRIFVDNVDPLFKILHIPTSEVTVYTVINNPGIAAAEALALCYSIYYAATVALDEREDCPQLLGEGWMSALYRYKAGLEQTFAQADLLENPTVVMLQAMAIYLVCHHISPSALPVYSHARRALSASTTQGGQSGR